ncbi:receptor-like protein 33 [Eucalyptus grandis]|uniref:receptor-like protein 33 n=1 Tax=Eucalyptus grandis TaxID=71139 RepID=UPI00192EF856|nr:receptor-like protein 33 [Eucalyptus grandis]
MLNLVTVDLSNNRFEGPLQVPPPITQFYFSANNKIGGKVSPLICNATELKVLDLSNNSLMGTLPECLMSFSKNLSVLNLRMNMIHGVIPRKFAEDNKLRTIDLSRNQFEGTLPRSLLHCENLEVLDLGNNKMKDTFPDWLGTLPKLQVLVLRSNMFHGFVSSPREARSFFELRIFDLSNNNLSGPLPVSYIMKLTAMIYQDKRQGKPHYIGDGNYQDLVMVTMKGLEIRLVKILTVFTSIDLSSNHFGGELLVYIGNLKSLKGLNFSHNNLTGYIPLSTGNLNELEWLDLSSNKFIGSIPLELADLMSLAFLNLSKNQIIGPIPRGRQFNTFKSDSFAMNPRLCGFPLSETCTNNPREIPPVTIIRENDTGHGGWFEWRAILMGYECGTRRGDRAGARIADRRSSGRGLRTVGHCKDGRRPRAAGAAASSSRVARGKAEASGSGGAAVGMRGAPAEGSRSTAAVSAELLWNRRTEEEALEQRRQGAALATGAGWRPAMGVVGVERWAHQQVDCADVGRLAEGSSYGGVGSRQG